MKAEISYDFVMEDDMEFVEGTYRIPSDEWQVFVFKRGDVTESQIKPSKWNSGITGLFVRFPR